jgi:hypothetical protein
VVTSLLPKNRLSLLGLAPLNGADSGVDTPDLGHKIDTFPVFFPAGREFLAETGSQQTASTARICSPQNPPLGCDQRPDGRLYSQPGIQRELFPAEQAFHFVKNLVQLCQVDQLFDPRT